MVEIKRCDWAENSELERNYHDHEWGRPVHDEHKLFKMLILEGQQAGLSWQTILSKMDAMTDAYENFDPEILSNYDEQKIEELLSDQRVIRNRLKIKAVIKNAKAYLKLKEEYGSLDSYIWSFVDNEPIVNSWSSIEEVPARTDLSDKISKELKKKGFSFVGSTTVYAFMQSIGMVNDHLLTCDFRI